MTSDRTGSKGPGLTFVEDTDGRRYALLKRSRQSSLVFDPETGQRCYRPNNSLELIGNDLSSAELYEQSLSDRVGAHATELLSLLALGDQLPIETIVEATTLCESDLVAIRSELEAAGLITTETVGADRVVRLTDRGRAEFDDDQS